jgi:hypothetical protein
VVSYYCQRKEKKMLIITFIAYFLDIKHYGKDFVEENCNLFERVGKWFLTFGWIEIILLCYYFITH